MMQVCVCVRDSEQFQIEAGRAAIVFLLHIFFRAAQGRLCLTFSRVAIAVHG